MHYYATGLFLYPLKTSEDWRISDVYKGNRKRPVAWNGLSQAGFPCDEGTFEIKWQVFKAMPKEKKRLSLQQYLKRDLGTVVFLWNL